MKIAVIGTRGFPNVQGGVEKHCEKLYPELVNLGCKVTVFGRKPYVGHCGYRWQGIEVVSIRCPRNKAFETIIHSLKSIFAAKRIRPDLVHIQAIGPSLVVPLAKLLGLKVVVTHHGPDYERAKWGRAAKFFLKRGERIGAKSADEVICISEVIKDRLSVMYGRAATVIPNGVDIPEGQNGDGQNRDSPQKAGTVPILEQFGLERGKYVLCVARFVPEKNLEKLIEGFGGAQGQSPAGTVPFASWKLVIVGEADHEDRYSKGLRAKVEDEVKKGIPIVLTGFLSGEPLKELYGNAGLFVLPSLYEGLPIALLEAMSFGLNIIASDIPQNREVGLRGERYFNPNKPQEIAEKMREFMDKGLDEQEKQEYLALLREKYDWGKIARKTMEVYCRVQGSGAVGCGYGERE